MAVNILKAYPIITGSVFEKPFLTDTYIITAVTATASRS